MFTKGHKKGTFRFVLTPANSTKKVFVAGDFTDWQPVRMRKQKNNSYAVTFPLAPGTYQYKFQVDDSWLLDPDNNDSALNSYGTLNSLARIQ